MCPIVRENLTFEEFVSWSKSRKTEPLTGRSMTGYFNWRSAAPDFIFFGFSPQICPNLAIEKSRVERIQPNQTLPCIGIDDGHMWSGTIYLKEDMHTEKAIAADLADLAGKQGYSDLASATATTVIWYSLQRNLRRDGAQLWGKWTDDVIEVCQDLGLERPIDTRYLLKFYEVGRCHDGGGIFLIEIPKYLSHSTGPAI